MRKQTVFHKGFSRTISRRTCPTTQHAPEVNWTFSTVLTVQTRIYAFMTMQPSVIGTHEMELSKGLFPCSISFAESFVTYLRNKAYVYLLTYTFTFEWTTHRMSYKLCLSNWKLQLKTRTKEFSTHKLKHLKKSVSVKSKLWVLGRTYQTVLPTRFCIRLRYND